MAAGAGAPGNGRVAQATLTVHYDATAQSYTITYPFDASFAENNPQTFRPADIQASTDPNISIYRHQSNRASGDPENDTLFLTKNSASTFSYVGAGVTLRGYRGTLANEFIDTDAFTYGLNTADAAVPRSGTAHFNAFLVGAYVHDAQVSCGGCDVTGNFIGGLTGTGGVDVNFATGVLGLTGQAQELDRATGVAGALTPFSGTANLAASTNNFSGTFSYGSGTPFNGNWFGRFYGPAAEELGATFYASGSGPSGGKDVVIGGIVGKRGTISTSTLDSFAGFGRVADIPGATTFAPEFATGADHPAAAPNGTSLMRDVVPDLQQRLRDVRRAGTSER